jgi:hypothetical protein
LLLSGDYSGSLPVAKVLVAPSTAVGFHPWGIFAKLSVFPLG